MWIYIWTCSMDTNMQNERRNLHAAWTWTSKGIKTWTRSMDMGIAWTWKCSIDLDTQHGPGHAARILSCSMDLNMHQGHGDAQRTCTWIMDLDTDHIHIQYMHHVLGHASRTYSYTVDIDIDIEYYWTGAIRYAYANTWGKFVEEKLQAFVESQKLVITRNDKSTEVDSLNAGMPITSLIWHR
jgi:hypothetical protein